MAGSRCRLRASGRAETTAPCGAPADAVPAGAAENRGEEVARRTAFELRRDAVGNLQRPLCHADADLTLLAVTGLTHRQAYKDIFVITMIKTAAVFVVIGFYYLTGIY